jgi:hypothetical protein
MEELKQIDRAVANGRKGQQQDMQTAEKFHIDALAIAGTRNTIAALVEVCLFLSIHPYSFLPFILLPFYFSQIYISIFFPFLF